jgi:hypothetical protein
MAPIFQYVPDNLVMGESLDIIDVIDKDIKYGKGLGLGLGAIGQGWG